MFFPQIPSNKIGTPFQFPGWRYDAVFNPARYGLELYCSKRKDSTNQGFLKRMIGKHTLGVGVAPATVYNLPTWFKEVSAGLTPDEAGVLTTVWNKYYFGRHKRKLTFNAGVNAMPMVSWSVKAVKKLNDEMLRRLVLHQSNYRYDHSVQTALVWYKDTNNSELIKHVNYACYGGMTDLEMAKLWKQPVDVMRSIRLLFFDYSATPGEGLGAYAFLRQLKAAGDLDDQEYTQFQKIHDLGRLGLDAILGTRRLSDAEKRKVENYLGSAVLDNVLDLKYTIGTKRDALDFNNAVMRIGTYRREGDESIGRLELVNQQLLKAKNSEIPDAATGVDDALLTMAEGYLRGKSTEDHMPRFETFDKMKSGELDDDGDKITVENQ